jgi:hypothetical protein
MIITMDGWMYLRTEQLYTIGTHLATTYACLLSRALWIPVFLCSGMDQMHGLVPTRSIVGCLSVPISRMFK